MSQEISGLEESLRGLREEQKKIEERISQFREELLKDTERIEALEEHNNFTPQKMAKIHNTLDF